MATRFGLRLVEGHLPARRQASLKSMVSMKSVDCFMSQ